MNNNQITWLLIALIPWLFALKFWLDGKRVKRIENLTDPVAIKVREILKSICLSSWEMKEDGLHYQPKDFNIFYKRRFYFHDHTVFDSKAIKGTCDLFTSMNLITNKRERNALRHYCEEVAKDVLKYSNEKEIKDYLDS